MRSPSVSSTARIKFRRLKADLCESASDTYLKDGLAVDVTPSGVAIEPPQRVDHGVRTTHCIVIFDYWGQSFQGEWGMAIYKGLELVGADQKRLNVIVVLAADREYLKHLPSLGSYLPDQRHQVLVPVQGGDHSVELHPDTQVPRPLGQCHGTYNVATTASAEGNFRCFITGVY